jgi:transaldolase
LTEVLQEAKAVKQTNYLQWLSQETATAWWDDSADPEELCRSLANGAVGVTTNPVLSYSALRTCPPQWVPALRSLAANLRPEERAQGCMEIVLRTAAQLLLPVSAALITSLHAMR